jgi:hypothetical protein
MGWKTYKHFFFFFLNSSDLEEFGGEVIQV